MVTYFTTHCRTGFALPTILLTSTILMIVLAIAATAATSISTSLSNQYYRQVAHEAAESGAIYASGCLKDNNNNADWKTNSKTLQPNTDCSGNAISGVSHYIVNTSSVRSTFVVDSTTVNAAVTQMHVTGTIELLRPSDGTVWQSYTYGLQSSADFQQLTATSIASGMYEVCGIIGHQTYCWGHNQYGQLGNGTTTASSVPTKVSRLPGGLDGKQDKLVAAGDSFTCIVTTDNQIYCMGTNGNGQLGNGTTTQQNVATPVTMPASMGGKNITGLVALRSAACALASGDVYCWGSSGAGDLGIGAVGDQYTPVLVNTIGASHSNPVTALSGTPYEPYACAIASSKVYCWGLNNRGEVGDGTTTNRNSPVAVSTSSGIGSRQAVGIASSGTLAYGSSSLESANTFAIMSDGSLWAWGDNQYGQMGQGTASTSPQLMPIQVLGLLAGKNIVQITTGMTTPCALTNTNSLYCWGQNNDGQVGDGTTTDRFTPTAVVMQTPGMAGATISLIIGGGYRNCAIANARSYCWGNNDAGQVGDGTLINRTVPTEATFLSQYVPVVYY